MTMLEILKKIDSEEIKDGTMFHGGDLFYNLIVIDKTLYVINEMSKNITPLESEIIGRYITNNTMLYEYKKVID